MPLTLDDLFLNPAAKKDDGTPVFLARNEEPPPPLAASTPQPAPKPVQRKPAFVNDEIFDIPKDLPPKPQSDFFNFDPSKLKADQQAADDKRAGLAAIGAIGDTFGSTNGFGNYFLGRMNEKATGGSKLADQLSSSIQDPVERQAKLFGLYKNSAEGKQLQDQMAQLEREKDPSSKESMALKQIAPRWGIKVTPEMSAYEIKQLINPQKMMETEAASNVDFNKQKALRTMDFQNDMAKLQMQLQTPHKQFENLPKDKQLTIEELAKKNANKISIRNQINAALAGWDKLSPDQQVATGRQLIKTLNSTEGADAVGAEEAKRLGGKLEFAMGNFFNSNPTQFGRDLPGFKEQAKNVSDNIGTAVKSNQSIIDQSYGRTGGPVNSTVGTVQVIDPGGKLRNIPITQLQAALAAGGKLPGGQR